MSSRLSSVTFQLSAAISISDETRSRAVSVEWPFLYADWRRGIKLLADNRRVTLLSLLDMSAAFDCVDHSILLNRLQVAVGIGSTALDWIRSFLSGRTQQVVYGGEHSVTLAVLFGVPQGSVLEPLLYVLYTAPLFNVIAQHQVDAHQYAVSVHAAVGSFGRHWPPRCVSRRRRSLAENQPAKAQSKQNSGHVAWICTAVGQGAN